MGISLINFERLLGMKVITSSAYVLGEIKGARVDTEKWKISYLNVKLSDTAAIKLGFKKRFRSSTVCVPVSMVQAVGDLVTIGAPLEEISKSREIEEYKE